MAKKLTRNNLFVDLRQNVYQGQRDTHVWIAAVRDETGDTSVFENVGALWNDIVRRSADRTTVFVSNLKEKGAPMLFYLLTDAGYLNAFDEETKSFYPEKEIIVDSTCCAGSTPENHEKALQAMKACQIDIL